MHTHRKFCCPITGVKMTLEGKPSSVVAYYLSEQGHTRMSFALSALTCGAC